MLQESRGRVARIWRAVVLVLLLATNGPAEARDKPRPLARPLGEWVITVRQTRLAVGDKAVATIGAGAPLLVKRTQSPWRWVEYGDVGWVREQDVVPLKQAGTIFTDRLNRNPADRDAYFSRGVARLWSCKVGAEIHVWPCNLKSAELVVADFTEAIRLSPETANAYAFRAEAFRTINKRTHAIADIDQALRLDPRNPDFRVLRGMLAAEDDNLDAAFNWFTRALEIDAESVSALLCRSELWRAVADGEKARFSKNITKEDCQARRRNDLDEAIRIDPDHIDARGDRADELKELERYDAAIQDYDVIIQFDPKGTTGVGNDARISRGECWTKLGEYQKAIEDYTESIQYEEKQRAPGGTGRNRHGAQYALRAELYAACPDPQIRDAQQAIADGKRASEIAGSFWNGEALASLAAAYAEAGDFTKAVEWQTKAIHALEKDRDAFKEDPVNGESAEKLKEFRPRLALYESGRPYRLPTVVRE